jgi:Kef-type K+ transport system membrane component KefB/nucleotide-binding universal stress UspA family protein
MPHLDLSALAVLLAQIAAILLVSRVLGLLTRWLGQPLVIAEILAGILLGPSLLGWLAPGAMQALFPESSLPALKMLSQVGLVLFMFLIGLELDLKVLKARTRSSIAISHSSIVVPFGLGACLAVWLYEAYAPESVTFNTFALFIGTSLSVTAFPVLARILSERNLLRSRVGTIAIACAAVDDVTAWCLLAFVVAVAGSHGIAQALWTTSFAIAFILGMLLLVRPFLQRLGARVANREGLTHNVISAILLLLTCASLLTELIGIHALFGAFLFGAILPKDGKLAETLSERLESVAVLLLLPLFFAYSGLRTELALVSGAREWFITCVIIAVATLGKFGGSAIAARVTGLRWREASAIGILMNTRGLMELIVLNIGLDLGVISPTLFTMLVIMALVTTFVTTPLLRTIYPDHELATDRVVASPGAGGATAPYTIVMCVSDPTHGPSLVTLAAALAHNGDSTRAFALHLWPPSDRPSLERARLSPESTPLRALLSHAQSLKLPVEPLVFASADPPRDICNTAKQLGASLVLIGAHKPLLLEGSLSGTVGGVLTQLPATAGVLVNRGLSQVRRVLVAFAGGAEDMAALRVARRFLASPGVEITLLHVVSAERTEPRARGRHRIDAIFDEPDVDHGRVRVLVTEHDSPPDAVLDEAERGYDLIVLGMRDAWGFDRGVLGLRRQRVLSEAPVSILVVHEPAGPAFETELHPAPSGVASSPTT